jgi:hypothetical protein
VTSALKMETTRFFETLAFTNQSTRRPNPNEHHQNRHHPEYLRSHNITFCTATYNAKSGDVSLGNFFCRTLNVGNIKAASIYRSKFTEVATSRKKLGLYCLGDSN